MDVDLKAVAIVVAPALIGGGTGFVSSEVQLAALAARVTSVEEDEKSFASKESVEAVTAQQEIYIEAMRVIHDDIDARLDRHNARLNRLEDAE